MFGDREITQNCVEQQNAQGSCLPHLKLTFVNKLLFTEVLVLQVLRTNPSKVYLLAAKIMEWSENN